MTNLSDLARAVDVGLTVVSRRFLTLLALTMTFGLFCWAMILGTILGIIIAGAFGVAIFLPVLYCDRPSEAKWQNPES